MAGRNALGQFVKGNLYGRRWLPGQSGNAGHKTHVRREFDKTLADALTGEDPNGAAQELASLAWKAARKGEAWAITLLFSRLAPQPVSVKVSRGKDDDEQIDFSKLSREEFDQFGKLLEKATPAVLGDGSSESKPS
jgi:hypothetical protein